MIIARIAPYLSMELTSVDIDRNKSESFSFGEQTIEFVSKIPCSLSHQ